MVDLVLKPFITVKAYDRLAYENFCSTIKSLKIASVKSVEDEFSNKIAECYLKEDSWLIKYDFENLQITFDDLSGCARELSREIIDGIISSFEVGYKQRRFPIWERFFVTDRLLRITSEPPKEYELKFVDDSYHFEGEF